MLAELMAGGPGARPGLAGHDIEPAGEPVLYPAELDEIIGFTAPLAAAGGQHPEIEVELAGPPGSGKTVLAVQAGQKLGKRLLSVDAAMLVSHPDPAAVAIREVRQARLHGCSVVWQHADQLPPAAGRRPTGFHDRVLRDHRGRGGTGGHGSHAATLRAAALDHSARLRLWSVLSTVPPRPRSPTGRCSRARW